MADDDLGLYVVADGMGGHSAGEVASSEAIEMLHDVVRRERDALTQVQALPSVPELLGGSRRPLAMRRALRILESAVQHATYMVFGMAESNPERRGMGTTLSVLFLRGDFALTAQVGDSRVYRVRAQAAEQITEDHTLIAWQLKRGLITPEQARRSQQKNVITRAVGSRDYVQVDTNFVTVEPGDTFLLCSDGLHAYLSEPEIARVVLELGPEAASQRFVELANERGGHDNITSVVVELAAVPGRPAR